MIFFRRQVGGAAPPLRTVLTWLPSFCLEVTTSRLFPHEMEGLACVISAVSLRAFLGDGSVSAGEQRGRKGAETGGGEALLLPSSGMSASSLLLCSVVEGGGIDGESLPVCSSWIGGSDVAVLGHGHCATLTAAFQSSERASGASAPPSMACMKGLV